MKFLNILGYVTIMLRLLFLCQSWMWSLTTVPEKRIIYIRLEHDTQLAYIYLKKAKMLYTISLLLHWQMTIE